MTMSLAPAIPQPTKSNSYSRTTQVIGELETVWEALQKDLVSVRTQLEQAREAKKMHDQQTKSYAQSNKECRNHIQVLMTLLESKQHDLKETKQVSAALETQAKQLKDDAVDARRQADALKRQERQLGQEKEAAVLAKARVAQQHKVLQQAVNDLDRRARHERSLLQKQLTQVQSQLNQVMARNQLVLLLATGAAAVATSDGGGDGVRTTQRQAWLQHVQGLQHQLLIQDQQQLDGGVDKIRRELDGLIASATCGEMSMDQMVTQCQDEVHGLIQRIQSYSVVVPQ